MTSEISGSEPLVAFYTPYLSLHLGVIQPNSPSTAHSTGETKSCHSTELRDAARILQYYQSTYY